ncbi:hypothetical protein BDY17DRAFT_102017 [Neohortaea acidophila]|uniref:PH domain-containing protein n=1 Tax=Neohortaea acidophila TaxID=245834 RepID=A0A6A6Q054_9PEZI|nr:uncharacterized protein BDY17DRAFT_102017 [Neohortaea acidophila]KAF2485374.1 hypothetical protein BDY17DRAFT_102017 [Neohortaea acidophila]
MPRSRVLSFMSQWGSPSAPRSPDPNAGAFTDTPSPSSASAPSYLRKPPPPDIDIAQAASQRLDAAMRESGGSPTTHSRSRGDLKPKRTSMLQSYVPPQVDVARDTPPELQPIFTYLNSHSNKLYQEGYFLKLHDLDSRGRPSAGRTWTECFAQLIGTVLSLWDAAALDAAGEDAEVVPTFINLSDASIKMIESLPMNGAQGGNLQNVLSVSTAANNRYLLHFNTLNSLTQWTAGIRLAMFEHATLQEAYTGSLIAGKGRYLNNIKQIMFRLKYPHEDWVRVRFGAGTPWQRCWCVISPPEEKSWEKAQKAAKKAGPYERVKYPKGDIKFYDTRKINKKTLPIATITDAFAAYAVYPQSKPLIEQSTLLKIEGLVNVHDSKDQTTEGFVFVMPEVHQAVTGFEMMLRWLFPAYDTFSLYGRPQKLIADTLDQRGLMFAMPTNRRYGYLDILDVSTLIHTKGSQGWSERQWRRELKKLTAERMTQQLESHGAPDPRSRANTDTLGVRFGDGEVSRSTPGSRSVSPAVRPGEHSAAIPRTNTAPPDAMGNGFSPHKRAASEAQGYRRYQTETPSRLSQDARRPDSSDGFEAPPPPPHMGAPGGLGRSFTPGSLERIHSESTVPTLSAGGSSQDLLNGHQRLSHVEPVLPPPAFTHPPNSRPANQPYAPPELRRANSTVDAETLAEMKDAVTPQPYYDGGLEPWSGEVQHRQQNMDL